MAYSFSRIQNMIDYNSVVMVLMGEIVWDLLLKTFIDLSIAFDCVIHDICFLQIYGIMKIDQLTKVG